MQSAPAGSSDKMTERWFSSLLCKVLDQQAGVAYRVGFARGGADSAAVAMRQDD
jgi:hypothetical protein